MEVNKKILIMQSTMAHKEVCSEQKEGKTTRLFMLHKESILDSLSENISHVKKKKITIMNLLLLCDTRKKRKEGQAPKLLNTSFSLLTTTVKKFSPANQYFIKTKVFFY